MSTKAGIRLEKLATRLLKPRYKHLTPTEKRLVKLCEKRKNLTRSIARTEKIMVRRYGEYWRQEESAKQDNNYALFFEMVEMDYKTGKSIIRMEQKYNLDCDAVMYKFRFEDPRVHGSGSF